MLNLNKMLEALIILFLLSNAYICSEELNSFTSNKLKVKSKLETSIVLLLFNLNRTKNGSQNTLCLFQIKY